MQIKFIIYGLLILFAISLGTGAVLTYKSAIKENTELKIELELTKKAKKQCELQFDEVSKSLAKSQKELVELQKDYEKLKKRRK